MKKATKERIKSWALKLKIGGFVRAPYFDVKTYDTRKKARVDQFGDSTPVRIEIREL